LPIIVPTRRCAEEVFEGIDAGFAGTFTLLEYRCRRSSIEAPRLFHEIPDARPRDDARFYAVICSDCDQRPLIRFVRNAENPSSADTLESGWRHFLARYPNIVTVEVNQDVSDFVEFLLLI
jgi:hypothetical protein